MHEHADLRLCNKNMRFAIPVIIISTITGTANFAQGSFPDGVKISTFNNRNVKFSSRFSNNNRTITCK